MNIVLKPCWADTMSIRAFAKKAGVPTTTIFRWCEEFSPLAASYLTLCVILGVSPQDILDGKTRELVELKGLSIVEVCFACGFDPFSFCRVSSGDRTPNVLVHLNSLYKIYGSFEPLFDVNQVRKNVMKRLNRIEALLATS